MPDELSLLEGWMEDLRPAIKKLYCKNPGRSTTYSICIDFLLAGARGRDTLSEITPYAWYAYNGIMQMNLPIRILQSSVDLLCIQLYAHHSTFQRKNRKVFLFIFEEQITYIF